MAGGEGGVVHLCGAPAHHDGMMASAQAVHKDAGVGAGNGHLLQAAPIVAGSHKAVGGLGPFEADERALLELVNEKSGIEGLEGPGVGGEAHLHACLAQARDALPSHFGVGVLASDDDLRYAVLQDEVGTGRGFAVVVAGFEAHIKAGGFEQIFVAYAVDGHYLGMRAAGVGVKAFAYDGMLMNNEGTYEGIGKCAAARLPGQLYTAAEVCEVFRHKKRARTVSHRSTPYRCFLPDLAEFRGIWSYSLTRHKLS